MRKEQNKTAKNGFTLVEVLIAMILAAIIASICMLQAGVLVKGVQVKPDHQEQFAILQIRELVSLSAHAFVRDRNLVLVENGEEEVLELDQNRLVKRPGYEILMENLEDVYFEQKEQKLYLVFTKNKRTKTFQIG
ncbi:MAG: prepilin-type N-terminal cleavage/methylation domain-containing protein [Erysipelotrichaceae bacterium]|nr:prepilin-type N-terminal cleavage/methylation domain-containing protein [Erysipelotrichaceae bacterium]